MFVAGVATPREAVIDGDENQNCEMNFQLSIGTQFPGGEAVWSPTKMQARVG